jgi:hypothetical protein
LPRCLGQLELHRATCLLLPDCSPVCRIATRRNVIDLERDDIATAQLAVDGEIEQSEVANTTFDWSFVRMDQTCLGRSGGFAPTAFPLFQGTRSQVAAAMLEASVMMTLLNQ